MRIHREGHKIIIFSFLLLVLIAVMLYSLIPFPRLALYLVYVGLAAFFFLIVRFFRDPGRKAYDYPPGLISPCDGKVVIIKEIEDAEFFGDRRIQVSIFMSPRDIHINWYPISGIIIWMKYFPGKYFVAWHPKSSLLNERTSVVIKHESGSEVLVRQVAGAVARRVACYAKEGNHCKQGDELGFIKFGSRVDLLLPIGSIIKVELNQMVIGRQTVIADLP